MPFAANWERAEVVCWKWDPQEQAYLSPDEPREEPLTEGLKEA